MLHATYYHLPVQEKAAEGNTEQKHDTTKPYIGKKHGEKEN